MLMVSQAIIGRLRISGPRADRREVEETKRALREGREMLRREGNDKPSFFDVVWRLLQDAAETLHRLPDRERSWLLSCERSAWPELARSSEECRKVEWEIGLEEAAGVRPVEKAPIPKLQITDPSAGRRMLVVLGWLKYAKSRGHQMTKRDKLILLTLASGRGIQAAKQYMHGHRTDRAVYMVKGKILGQIVQAIKVLDCSENFGSIAPQLG